MKLCSWYIASQMRTTLRWGNLPCYNYTLPGFCVGWIPRIDFQIWPSLIIHTWSISLPRFWYVQMKEFISSEKIAHTNHHNRYYNLLVKISICVNLLFFLFCCLYSFRFKIFQYLFECHGLDFLSLSLSSILIKQDDFSSVSRNLTKSNICEGISWYIIITDDQYLHTNDLLKSHMHKIIWNTARWW